MTILVKSKTAVYLIDVTTLQQDAFETSDPDGRSLRAILECRNTTKVFFDIRRDSDALYSLYGVRVSGIEDLQLMELASRVPPRRYLNGLAKCVERDCTLGFSDRQAWQRVKDNGLGLFSPSRGGSYSVFDQRPMAPEIMKYCVQDVTLMPHLREIYRPRLCDAWWRKIEAGTQARIQLSQSADFDPNGAHMAEGPREWQYWEPTAEEKARTTLLEVRNSQIV